jgi:RNA polymerase sigma factor (TIGR02999 family)
VETPDAIAKLMKAFRRGDPAAGSALANVFYPELRRLAAAKMKGERSAHTWQPTALVHELYLELVKVRALSPAGSDDDRAAFLGLTGHMMKRLLIHHARPLYRRAEQVEMSEDAEAADTKAESLQEIEDALAGLAAIDQRLRTVVEMKVFEGLTGDEIARQLGCSRGTVNNWWRFAQSWLQEEWAPGRRG